MWYNKYTGVFPEEEHMGNFLANAQAILDAKPKSITRPSRKGGGGGGGASSTLRLIRIPKELLSEVNRVHDVRRKEIQGMPIQCHMTEMKGGSEEAVDGDEHLFHEFKIRRIKRFLQDWSSASRGLFRFEDEKEEEEHAHSYTIRQNKREKNLIQLILKVLLYVGADDSVENTHYYTKVQEQAQMFDELYDTLETIRPFWKTNAPCRPLQRLSRAEIDQLLYS